MKENLETQGKKYFNLFNAFCYGFVFVFVLLCNFSPILGDIKIVFSSRTAVTYVF